MRKVIIENSTDERCPPSAETLVLKPGGQISITINTADNQILNWAIRVGEEGIYRPKKLAIH